MFKFNKTAVRVVVAACLAVPFLITEISKGLEPYPAVLQPSGAYTVSTADNILTFKKMQLIARDLEGSELVVDTDAFMGTIPHHFWTRIAGARFGLSREASDSKQETLNWIQARLLDQGIDRASTLVVRYIALSFDVNSGKEIHREVTKQIDVDLL